MKTFINFIPLDYKKCNTIIHPLRRPVHKSIKFHSFILSINCFYAKNSNKKQELVIDK